MLLYIYLLQFFTRLKFSDWHKKVYIFKSCRPFLSEH